MHYGNPYAYAGNAPTNWSDPLGLQVVIRPPNKKRGVTIHEGRPETTLRYPKGYAETEGGKIVRIELIIEHSISVPCGPGRDIVGCLKLLAHECTHVGLHALCMLQCLQKFIGKPEAAWTNADPINDCEKECVGTTHKGWGEEVARFVDDVEFKVAEVLFPR